MDTHPLQPPDQQLQDEEIDLRQPGATSYINQWEVYFGLNRQNFSSDLKEAAMHGRLRSCHFRSVCWRLFLNCLPYNLDYWESTVEQSRRIYTEVKSRHIFDPHDKQKPESNLQLENPLSLSDESNWSRFFKNNDVKTMIERDVQRTCPEMDFFHKVKVRKMLGDILFCYACEHPSISYKQGMHELLAPLLFVLHCDLQGFAHATELGFLPQIISKVLDIKYLEHDAYDMFCKLMLATNGWYSVNGVSENTCQTEAENSNDNDDEVQASPFQPAHHQTTLASPSFPKNSSPLIITKKLTFIHHHLLAKHDKELYLHLEQLQIIPQVYGLRWIRLLFGREFVLQDLLVLWDAIFADSSKLDLVDYLFTAMMHRIRDGLIGGDYCQCMQILMKYPPTADVYDLVELALHYRNPQTHRKPAFSLRKKSAGNQHNKAVEDKGKKPTATRFLPTLKIENPFSSLGREMKKSMSSINRQPSQERRSSNTDRQPASSRGEAPAPTATSPTSNLIASAVLNSKINVMKNLSNMFDSSVEVNNDVGDETLKKRLKEVERKCKFCAQQIDNSIKLLQHNLIGSTQQHVINADDSCVINSGTTKSMNGGGGGGEELRVCKEETYLALASLKQVRDILRGNLNISQYVRSQNIPTSPSLDSLTESELFEENCSLNDRQSPYADHGPPAVTRKNTL